MFALDSSRTVSVDELLSLSGTSVVLMPNDASARQLRDEIAARRGSHDQAFLEMISVVPLDQWLAELWDGSFPVRQVLRPIQLLALARQIIEGSEAYPANCLNPLAICRQFVDAFQQFHEYDLADTREHYLFSSEYQAFAVWRLALQARLDELGALASQQLPAALSELLRDNPTALPLPDHLVIAGELEIPPAAGKFLHACAEHCSISALKRAKHSAKPKLSFATQRRDECERVAEQLAATLRDCIESGAMKTPELAVLVPDYAAYAAPLSAALAQKLYPASLFPRRGILDEGQASSAVCEPWVFEGREKLLGFPLISAAWDLISITSSALPFEQLSRVLRSRFIAGWPEYRSARAALDLRWRENLGTRSSLQAALSVSVRSRSDQEIDEQALVAPLQAVAEYLAALPRRQLPSAWVRSFDQLLLQAGWPNAADDDPVVMQCRRGFSQAMDVFRAMDRQLGKIRHGDALSWLQHILSTKRFAISRDWDCPIRIMTLDDAVGRQFDTVWVLGVDDTALPRRAEPSPFLPLSLQRAAGIPESDPGLMIDRDRQLLEGIISSAPQINLSYCGQDEAGVVLEPSSLLASLNISFDSVNTEFIGDFSLPYSLSGELDFATEDSVSPISDAEKSQIRGGSGLFKEYANSPFFAFAKYRLKLDVFPETTEGLDHRVQGILVHNSLQYFWEEVRDKASLDAMTDRQVVERVEACVERAMNHPDIAAWRLGEALVEIEKARIRDLVSAWIIEKEKQRIDAFKVVATERGRRADLMGIPLNLRIDRIDEVASSEGLRRLVIDYKTGTVQGRALNSDQLTEPQLPIYALVEAETEGRIDGVMLAQLKSPDDLALHMRSNWASSVVKKNRAASDVASDEAWQNELKAWSGALADMAAGILAGDIRHDYSVDHRRGFSAAYLPLLRGVSNDEADADGEDG